MVESGHKKWLLKVIMIELFPNKKFQFLFHSTSYAVFKTVNVLLMKSFFFTVFVFAGQKQQTLALALDEQYQETFKPLNSFKNAHQRYDILFFIIFDLRQWTL